jgi:hypothetical protein
MTGAASILDFGEQRTKPRDLQVFVLAQLTRHMAR